MPYVAKIINILRDRIYENAYLGNRPIAEGSVGRDCLETRCRKAIASDSCAQILGQVLQYQERRGHLN